MADEKKYTITEKRLVVIGTRTEMVKAAAWAASKK